jgi:hypothetical protein
MPGRPSRSPARRIWTWRHLTALAVLFVASLPFILSWGLNTRWMRRAIADAVTKAASGAIDGELVVLRIANLQPTRVSGIDLVIRDAAGDTVIEVADASARVDLWTLFASLLASDPVVVVVPEVTIARASVDATFLETGTGAARIPKLQDAFRPSSSAKPQSSPARPAVLLSVQHVAIEVVDVRYPLAGSETALARLEHLRGRVLLAEGLQANIHEAVLDAVVPTTSLPFRAKVGAALNVGKDGVQLQLAAREATVGDVSVELDGALGSDRLSFVLSASGDADAWAPLGARVGIGRSPGDLRLTAAGVGNWEQLTVGGLARVDEERLRFASELNLEQSSLALSARSTPLSLADLDPGLPALVAALEVQTSVAWSHGLVVSARGALRSIRYDQRRFPDLSFRADYDVHRVALRITAIECHCVELAVQSDPAFEKIDFELSAELAGSEPALVRVQREFGIRALGLMKLSAQGSYRPLSQAINMRAQGQLKSLEVKSPSIGIGRARFDASVTGSVPKPHVAAELAIEQLRTKDVSVSRFRAGVDGRPPGLTVTASGWGRIRADGRTDPVWLTARGRVREVAPFVIDAVRFQAWRAGHGVMGQIDELALSPSLRVRRLLVDGVGTLRGDLLVKDGQTTLDGTAQGLNLGAISDLARPWVPSMGGLVEFHVSLTGSSEKGFNGSSEGRSQDVDIAGVATDFGAWSMVSEAGALTGSIEVNLKGSDTWVRLDANEVRVAPELLRGGDPSRALHSGRLVLSTSADVAQLYQLVTGSHAVIGGQLWAEVTVDKDAGSQLVVAALARASALRFPTDFATKQPTAAADPRAVFDSTLRMSYDPIAGSIVATLEASDATSRSSVLSASASLLHPSAAWFGPDRGNALGRTPFVLDLHVPRAQLAHLPIALLPVGISGALDGEVHVDGTLLEPHASGRISIYDFSLASTYSSYPVTTHVQGNFGRGVLDLEAVVLHEGQVVASADAQVQNIGLASKESPRSYRATMEMDELPLGCFPYVRDYGVAGALDGRLTLTAERGRPLAEVDVVAKSLEVLGVPFREIRARASVRKDAVQAKLDIVQPEGTAQLRASARFADATSSVLEKLQLELSAQNLEIAPLRLLATDLLSEFSGKVSGTVDVRAAPGGLVSQGSLTLTDGTLQFAALGQQFRDVRGELRVHPDGRMEISNVSASSLGGRVKGSAALEYGRAGIETLRADLTIPDDAPFPVPIAGLPRAEVSGKVSVTGTRRGDDLLLVIGFPAFDVYLEEDTDFDVQSTQAATFVHVGYKTQDGKFVSYDQGEQAERVGKSHVRLEVHLGKDVWIHRGEALFVAIHGKVAMDLDRRLSGGLTLDQGQVEVLGRVFRVRRGIITFRQDSPPNPMILAEASWESPSGYVVTARYQGLMKSGKLELQSEPPMSHSEILNVIVFDDPQGGLGNEDSGNPAGAVATTIAGSGLGRALSDLSHLDVTAGVDTSEEDAARPEIGMRISPRLSVEVAYNPEGGTTSLASKPDRALVSLRWQLLARWSVETTVGDQGTSIVDLVWRYRY